MSSQAILPDARLEYARVFGPIRGFRGVAYKVSTPSVIAPEPPAPEPPIVTGNLVAYYDAGNPASYTGSSTTWYDLSTYGNHATFNGTTYSSDNNGCITFDGINSYVQTPSLYGTGTSTFSQSICVWVSPNDIDGNIVMVQNPPGNWNMPPIVASGSKFRGKYWSNNFMFSSTYTNNDWYYVCVIFDYENSRQVFYVNGQQVDIQNGVSYVSSGEDNYFFLGKSNPGANNTGYFAGRIAALQVYSQKALSASEILQNFNATKSRFGL